jgi:hypothetical protein
MCYSPQNGNTTLYYLHFPMHTKGNLMVHLAIYKRAGNEMVWKKVRARFLNGKWMVSGQTRNESTC